MTPLACYDPCCPFCPGNEQLLPAILAETPMQGTPGWRTRVVPNKYPALSPGGDPKPIGGPQMRLAGFGYHEVIIESARHNADLTTLSDAEVRAVVETYRARFNELARRADVESIVVFRNRGRNAGASLVHPHSQVIATAIIPPRVAASARWAYEQFAETGCCATCRDLKYEMEDGRRIVEATAHFLTTVPFAATSPFELRITPLRHQPSFGSADDAELAELGAVLRRALLRLRLALADPSYNFAIESALFERANATSAHWCLRIVADLVTPGGFELASGIPINPSEPEADAELLRSIDLEGSAPADLPC